MPTAIGNLGNLGNLKTNCLDCQYIKLSVAWLSVAWLSVAWLSVAWLSASRAMLGMGAFCERPRPGPTHRRVWAGGLTKILKFFCKHLKQSLTLHALASLALLVIDFLSAALKLHT